MHRILIVDDDLEFRTSILDILRTDGFDAHVAPAPDAAIRMVDAEPFDVILLDVVMPRMGGLELLPKLKKIRPKIKVIMITAFSTVENAVEAIKLGASDYISKPFKIETLIMTIRRILEETRFEESANGLTVETTLHALAHVTRRKIIKLLMINGTMRLTVLTRELEMEDHTKVFFHLKIMRSAGLIDQVGSKTYSLTAEGQKAIECLKTVESYFSE